MIRENAILAIVVAITTCGMIAGYWLQFTDKPPAAAPEAESQPDKSPEVGYEGKHQAAFDALVETDREEVGADLEVSDETPDGTVIMRANGPIGSFLFWADNKNVKFDYLDAVAQFFCLTHGCKHQYASDSVETEPQEKTPGTSGVFAAFKGYNASKASSAAKKKVRNQFKYAGVPSDRCDKAESSEEPKVAYKEWAGNALGDDN